MYGSTQPKILYYCTLYDVLFCTKKNLPRATHLYLTNIYSIFYKFLSVLKTSS